MCGVDENLRNVLCVNNHKIHNKCMKKMVRMYVQSKQVGIPLECPQCKELVFYQEVFSMIRKMYKDLGGKMKAQRNIAKRRRTAIREIAKAFETMESSEDDEDVISYS